MSFEVTCSTSCIGKSRATGRGTLPGMVPDAVKYMANSSIQLCYRAKKHPQPGNLLPSRATLNNALGVAHGSDLLGSSYNSPV